MFDLLIYTLSSMASIKQIISQPDKYSSSLLMNTNIVLLEALSIISGR